MKPHSNKRSRHQAGEAQFIAFHLKAEYAKKKGSPAVEEPSFYWHPGTQYPNPECPLALPIEGERVPWTKDYMSMVSKQFRKRFEVVN